MPRTLTVFAVVLLAVLFPMNAGAIQGAGAAGLAWWIIGALLFALPSTAVILALAREGGSPFTALQRGGHLSHGGALGIWVAGTLAVLAAAIAAVSYAQHTLSVDLPLPVQGLIVVVLAVLGILSGRTRAWGPLLLVGAIALALVVAIGLMAVAVSGDPARGSTAERADWLALDGWSWLGLVVLGLVGAHVAHQRASLRPVPPRALWWAMAAVVAGYLGLTLAFAAILPADVAVTFTSLADLGATLGDAWGTVMGLLVAVAFVATTAGLGATFDELGGDLRLPRWSTAGLVVVAGIGCFLVIPLIAAGDDSGATASERSYAVLQGAAALLWALGYATFGLLAVRRAFPGRVRVAAVLTIALGLVGAIGVLAGPFTPLISDDAWSVDVLGSTLQVGTWAAWVAGVAAAAVALAWVAKAEQSHHA